MNWFLSTFFLLFYLHGFSQDIRPQDISNTDGYRYVWYSALKTNSRTTKAFEKVEIGVRMPDNIEQKVNQFIRTGSQGINPYDPLEVAIEAVFTSPTGVVSYSNGFYYQPYKRQGRVTTLVPDSTSFHWRIRCSPDEEGEWNVTVKVLVKNLMTGETTFNFSCIPSNHKGYLVAKSTNSANNRYLHYSKTKEPFFAIGGNITHSSYDFDLTIEDVKRHKMWLGKLADAGGNFYRLEFGAQTYLPDWNKVDDYSSRLREMYLFDEIVDYSQLRELYFILFRHHTEVEQFWKINPYVKKYSIGDSPERYFTDKELLRYQHNTLRYIFARWGYSPSFAFYEYQEIDRWVQQLGAAKTGSAEKKYINVFSDWFVSNKRFIRDSIKNKTTLMSIAYATTPNYALSKSRRSIFSECDVVTLHKYGSRPTINFESRAVITEKMWRRLHKPVILEEMGDDGNQIPIYYCTDMTFHADLWATSMMGLTGTGMHWWWDRGIYLQDYQKQYKNVQLFFQGIPLNELALSTQKWRTNNSSKQIYLENYAMLSKDKTTAFGWVKNASIHWRNLYYTDSCIRYLIDHNKGKDYWTYEDGWINNNPDVTFEDPKYVFADGKIHPIENNDFLNKNPQFDIKGLKSNPFQLFKRSRRHWYKIEFFYTKELNGNKLKKASQYTQILPTNSSGKLKPICPNTNLKTGDWSYKVNYLGIHRTAPKE